MKLISETDLQKLDAGQLLALREEFRKAIGEAAETIREHQAALENTRKVRRCRRTLRLNL